MVLGVVLVVLWIAVLGAALARWRSERRSGDSVSDFHRQLRILRRNAALRGSALHIPGHALSDLHGRVPVPAERPLVPVGRSTAPDADLIEELDEPGTPEAGAGSQPVRAAAIDPAVRAARARAAARRTRERRRNALRVLAASTLGLALVGAVPGLHLVLILATLSAALLAAYVTVLVRLRQMAELDRSLPSLARLPTAAPPVGAAPPAQRAASR